MAKLTKRTIDSAKPRARDYFLWDSELKGFGLRVLRSGRRSYVIQYRTNGRTRRLALGPHGVLTPAEARQKAVRLLAEVRNGGDPSEERHTVMRAPTMRDLAARYMDEHAWPKKKPSSATGDAAALRRHILPVLGHRKVTDVTRKDACHLHHALRNTPIMANRTIALLSKMMNLAERWELRPDASNPCRHVDRFRERRCERFLSGSELARLGDALRVAEESGTVLASAIAAIRLLALTGCRKSEILGLRWEHVDLERAYLRLPDSKTGAKAVHLNAPARQLLANLPRDEFPWVVPGEKTGTHLVNLRKPWLRICAAAGLDGVRIHDLRHSFASVGVAAGMGLPIIGRLLGHTRLATTERYAHLADDPLRFASEKIGERIGAALGNNPVQDVVSLERVH